MHQVVEKSKYEFINHPIVVYHEYYCENIKITRELLWLDRIWHLQTWRVFSTKLSTQLSGAATHGVGWYNYYCQNTERSGPETYPKHSRIGPRRKKLERFSDFRFYFQVTV